MLHNLEMPTQIYHMAALGLSEFWKTAPQLLSTRHWSSALWEIVKDIENWNDYCLFPLASRTNQAWTG